MTNLQRTTCLLLACLQSSVVLAQSPQVASPVPTAAIVKPYTFEVASIRPSSPNGHQHLGATPTGYEAENLSLIASIVMAYLPVSGEAFYTSGRIKGAPDWAMTDRYTIKAKVSDADSAEWQKPDTQKVILRTMLQSMLADRCKLVVHRENRETPVYELVLGKGGPKFNEAVEGAPHPAGVSLPGGGTLVPSKNGQSLSFYAVPMTSLTAVLANFAGRPVQDKTGLTKLYDLTLERDNPDPEIAGAASVPSGPPTYAVEALGLRLQKSTASVDTLVIDHMERPSEN